MAVSDVQLKKQLSPISVTLSGKNTVFRPEQSAKVPAGSEATPEGMITLVSLVQPLKACLPIVFRLLPWNVMPVMAVLPWNTPVFPTETATTGKAVPLLETVAGMVMLPLAEIALTSVA